MKQCPKCGAEYDPATMTICPACFSELPAPYEGLDEDVQGEDDSYGTANVAEPDGVTNALGAETASMAMRRAYLPPERLTILSGATIYLEDMVLDAGTLVIADGRIIEALNTPTEDPQNGATYFDLSGMIISSGFIDIHTHGLLGIDVNKASTEDFLRISAEAAKWGLTGIVPTTVACQAPELAQIMANIRAAREQGIKGARLLGLHLESNFISMDYKGAQPPDAIFPPNDPRAWEITSLLDEYAEEVCILTIAPELPGALELIPWLRERGIVASLGHSAANYDQAIAGFDAGATHATHLFNAMPPLHHRNPGLVGAALERDDVFTEMVCDGVHIHPAVMSMVISAKGADRFIPVSDALEGAGLPDGSEFYLGGQHVTVKDGTARLDSGTIAGSTTHMDNIVRLLIDRVGWDLAEALYMASTTPADGLELSEVGRIAQGMLADLVVLDQDLLVQMTLVGGQVVYQR